MRSILKEPLLHFPVIGAALFGCYALMSDGETEEGETQIVVSAGRIEQLAYMFAKTWLRAPTQRELKGLIDEFVLEELYYRQALEMRLDRDDTIIRRRLRQKLEFLTDDTSALAEPDDAELEKYLAANEDAFRESSTYTFEQAYFDPEKYREDAVVYVASQLAAARAGKAEIGDATLLPRALDKANRGLVDGTFGSGFAHELDTLEVGSWQGPVRSGLGLHLVRIDSKTLGRRPDLEEIRSAVIREWSNERRLALRQEMNDTLLERYDVVIEWPDAKDDGAPPNTDAATKTDSEQATSARGETAGAGCS